MLLDRTAWQQIQKLNNEIKVRHGWGKNRTYNLRSRQYAKRIGLLKYAIGNDADYAGFLYFGTKRHKILPRRKKALSWVQGGQRFFSKGHKVRGIKARPWIKRAWNSKKRGIMKILGDTAEKFFKFRA